MKARPTRAEVPTPDPVHETPPDDRFCDLILNGGVASGVVYPWALVELARHYRFRSIGGNSVGAMAAALAAAAEYGRCHGKSNAFEVLRRVPLDLAKEDDEGRTRMLRLFQPSPKVRRLFELFLVVIRPGNPVETAGLTPPSPEKCGQPAPVDTAGAVSPSLALRDWLKMAWQVLDLYRLGGLVLLWPPAMITLALVLSGGPPANCIALVLSAAGWLFLVVVLLVARLWLDLRALARNDFGLCTGKAQPPSPGQPPAEEALVEWLHRGIQLSAGRGRHDPPLTFTDLWHAPRSGQPPAEDGSAPGEPSIDLQMFSTIVSLGRPVSWPLVEESPRLFFRAHEWSRIFPESLLSAVVAVAKPYAPSSASDPDLGAQTHPLLEIPAGELPIAIAARMSLSFPLLFTCVPVYAIDYEASRGKRQMRPALLTDGGLCTNFPIHLFDAAHPRWPTFGLMLSRRLQNFENEPVWLPQFHLEGRADSWLRSVPGAGVEPPRKGLFGLLTGMLMTTLDWSDNLTSRLPSVRNRVLRMALKPGEGQLNIAMPGERILDMAHKYGTLGGQKLKCRFISPDGKPTAAWQEHLYVRAMNQLHALREHLRGYTDAVTTAGHSKPINDVLAQATRQRALGHRLDRFPDAAGGQLTSPQAAALQRAVEAVSALEQVLEQTQADSGPYQPVPVTKLRLRSRI